MPLTRTEILALIAQMPGRERLCALVPFTVWIANWLGAT